MRQLLSLSALRNAGFNSPKTSNRRDFGPTRIQQFLRWLFPILKNSASTTSISRCKLSEQDFRSGSAAGRTAPGAVDRSTQEFIKSGGFSASGFQH